MIFRAQEANIQVFESYLNFLGEYSTCIYRVLQIFLMIEDNIHENKNLQIGIEVKLIDIWMKS